MNLASLALGFAFIGIGIPFLAQAKKEADPQQQRNKKLAGIFFLTAGGAFFAAFVISAVTR